MTTAIGCIGVGKMGGALARRLATGGYEVHVYDVAPDAIKNCVTAGAVAATSATAVASVADVVVTSLPLPEQVLQTWHGLASILRDDAIAMDVSTIDPATARSLTETLAGAKHPFVSATLGKTPMAAERGEIPLFVGGDADAIETLRPMLERIGERIYDFGTPEAATTFKLISNLVGMTNMATLAEAYVFARRVGIDPQMFSDALRDTGGRSVQSDMRLPWLIDEDYTPRFDVELAAKDLRLGTNAAAQAGVPTPVSAQGLNQLLTALNHGHGDEDVIAIAKILDPSGALVHRGNTTATRPPD